jgi:hypothetical protein
MSECKCGSGHCAAKDKEIERLKAELAGKVEPETGILLERQAKRIMLLEAERAEAISRINTHCKDCGKDPAQCMTCALHPYKEPERWKTVLAGNWDEVPEND